MIGHVKNVKFMLYMATGLVADAVIDIFTARSGTVEPIRVKPFTNSLTR